MPKRDSALTVTDQFCGAGGSSQGAKQAAEKKNLGNGFKIQLALNHWQLAIDTHNTNFPDTDHDCTDIQACDPRRYPSTDILLTSPECTTHSPAGGNTHKALKTQMDLFKKNKIDPSTERSRATMWDVVRFAEYHQYRAIVTENVIEAKTRWPLFDVWLSAMHKLGYEHKCVYLNAMFCWPTPQSRDRMYVVFWKKGNKAPDLEFRPLAYSPKLAKDVEAVQVWKNTNRKFGKYGKHGQYYYACPITGDIVTPYYYAAFNCIDWSIPGTRIGDRKTPLKPKTMKRIESGIEKYGNDRFMIGKSDTGIVSPFFTSAEHSSQLITWSSVDPYKTQTTVQSQGIVVPNSPFIVNNYGTSNSSSIMNPIGSITAGGINHGIVTTENWRSFIGYYYGNSQDSGMTSPIGAATTKDRHYLVNIPEDKVKVEDCYYRMVKAHEVKKAMAFEDDYIVLGDSREQVKQCGNAVAPPAMRDIMERVIETLL
ncbi:MAG: DNA cytosine methyltransferase [Bacteroidota bacterium]|nr:DNA cytosine methyltransferase [Bacteroidota bacterium]